MIYQCTFQGAAADYDDPFQGLRAGGELPHRRGEGEAVDLLLGQQVRRQRHHRHRLPGGKFNGIEKGTEMGMKSPLAWNIICMNPFYRVKFQ